MIALAIGPTMAFLLIAVGYGYQTAIKGDKEKGFLRAMGLVLGFFIIVMSFFLVLFFINVMRIDREMSLMNKPMMMKSMGMMPMRPR